MAAPSTGPANASPLTRQIERLIDQLADPSARVRKTAQDSLLAIGVQARPALLAAASDGNLNVQRRTAARAILARLPLVRSGDPPALREAFRKYQAGDVAARLELARQWLAGTSPIAPTAIGRVLTQEVNLAIPWSLVADLSPSARARLASADGPVRLALDPAEPMSAPVRYLLVRARADAIAPDADRSEVLNEYRDLINGLSTVPEAAAAPLAQMADALCREARTRGDGAAEIAIRRQVGMVLPAIDREAPALATLLPYRVTRNPDGSVSIDQPDPNDRPEIDSLAVVRYLTTRLRLQRAAKPTAEMADVQQDLDAMGVSPDRPLIALLIALINDPLPAAGGLPEDVAVLVDEAVQDDAFAAVLRAIGHDGGDWAAVAAIARHAVARLDEQIRSGAAATSLADSPLAFRMRRMRVATAWLAAARAMKDAEAIAAARDAAATVVTNDRPPQNQWEGILGQGGSLFGKLYVAEAVRADQFADEAGVQAALDAMARVSPLDSMVALDVHYLLARHGREAEAAEVFSDLLADENAKLDRTPDDPTALNSVAWLCARSGRDVDRAYTLAKRACELMPNEAGLMDTLAEAAFRLGRADEAIQLEQTALGLQATEAPTEIDGDFTRKQLARFQEGFKPDDAERPLPGEMWTGDW